jgi:hypothetical protein
VVKLFKKITTFKLIQYLKFDEVFFFGLWHQLHLFFGLEFEAAEDERRKEKTEDDFQVAESP